MFTPRAIKQFDKEKRKTLKDVSEQILKEIEDGELTIEAAKEKWTNEVKKLQTKQKKERFKLPFEDYRKDLLKRIDNKEITVEDANEEFIEYSEKKPEQFSSESEDGFLSRVILLAKAMKTDPVTAFVIILSGEKIRKLENGAIIVYRGKTADEQEQLEWSLAERKRRGATKDLILDHTVPLQLGGLNNKKNLKLVSVEEWERYTPIENYLGDKLRTGQIKEKEARQLIKDFKAGKINENDIITN